jgi:membrane-bound ClpP family serine protease
MLVVPMNSDEKRRTRRMSMWGTVLFTLGIIALIASVATGSVSLAIAAVVVLIPGSAMLYQVGKSLS